jgi:asparagine synthase (glutamine-hydrolysing)
MCGIAGIWSSRRPVGQAAADSMTDSLARRGPDGRATKTLDDGRLVLGHRRLSIIDLSDAGSQPMCNEDGTVWLTFNGEIYNYAALRRELEGCGHVFRSHADSETIIHGYEEWGTDCVRRLRGIFAFGIYDAKVRSLFLARDHVGIKPLYFHRGPDTFIFGSQPRAILAAEQLRASVDRSAFSLYLAYGNVPGAACIYDGIEKLLPGHWLLLKDGALRIQQYWHLTYDPIIRDRAEAEDLVRSKVAECVRAQEVSDVPIGTLLSGGIDSTIVTSILGASDAARLSTFTIGFDEDESDESQYARLVAETLGTRHYEQTLTYAAACALLPDIVEATDEPFHLNGLFPFLAVSKLVQSTGIKVVLGGDGADELFAGYRWYESFEAAVASRGGESRFERLVRATGLRRPRPNWPIEIFFRYNGGFDHRSQADYLGVRGPGTTSDRLYAPLTRFWRPDSPSVLAAQFLDFNCFLVDHCLTKVDRMSMACGVEVRVPFLDVELVEAAFRIDHAIVFRESQRKGLLKHAMRACFPPGLDTARKKGFSSPLNAWLSNGLAQVGWEALRDGSLTSRRLIDGDSLRASYSRMNVVEQLLLISAELWSRRWIENDSASVCGLSESLLRNRPATPALQPLRFE